MTQFPDIFKCVASPRELVFPRTKLTGDEWLEEGAIIDIGVHPDSKDDFEAYWDFMRSAQREGMFTFETDIHNKEGKKRHVWRVVSRDPYEDYGSYAKVKFKAQLVGSVGEPEKIMCQQSPVTCNGEHIVCNGEPQYEPDDNGELREVLCHGKPIWEYPEPTMEYPRRIKLY